MAGESTPTTPAESTNTTPSAPATPPAAPPAPATPPGGFTPEQQVQIDKMMADHKRTLQRDLAAAQAKAAGFDTLNSQVSELLSSGLIPDVENLSDFKEQIGQTIETHKTEAEKLADEQTKISKALELAQGQAASATERYEKATTLRAISDEAIGPAIGPGAVELIQMKLAPLSKVDENGNVTVTMDVADEDGKVGPKEMTVGEAVKAMEADVTRYGTLFKSTVNGGAGGEVVNGVQRTQTGGIDWENMDMDKYVELRKKNPSVIDASFQ